ncbi:WhiB family transcriptional regulator [Kutzneria sp. NPDC051319]|uniref:WhiB family transcriptional regulator n=1 Tax=Kutzneria sp. NPDC051319 TaxID=3155047 RepID=UPI0034482FE1
MTSRRRTPQALWVVWEWQLRGACRDSDNAVFFHPDQERGPAKRLRADLAKQVCQRCPVIVECRRHAIRHEEPYGVWGGQDEDERRALLTRRRGQAQVLQAEQPS